jgi:rubrerythrin
MTDMKNASSAGASQWERELYGHLTSHVEVERSMLEQYKSAAEASSSKALAYLVDLLVEDEMRHHRIFTELAESLETQSLKPGVEPVVPYLDFNRADREVVLRLTDELLDNEKKDALELKRLQRELRDVKDTTLWSLLVDLMERDTEKHVALLKFIKNHTSSH